MIVPGKKYSALIQGYPNDTSGLYPVFISELHAIDKSLTTIKVKNKLSNYGKWMYEGKVYSSGSYIPLHPGMTVTVVFLTALLTINSDSPLRTVSTSGNSGIFILL